MKIRFVTVDLGSNRHEFERECDSYELNPSQNLRLMKEDQGIKVITGVFFNVIQLEVLPEPEVSVKSECAYQAARDENKLDGYLQGKQSPSDELIEKGRV